MALNTIAGFHIGGTEPIDDKFLLSKAQMLVFDDNIAPQSFLCCCTDDNKVYQYIKTNDVDVTTGKFRVFESGSGGDKIQYDTLPTNPTFGQIIQWVGTTTTDLINGRFYRYEANSVTWMELFNYYFDSTSLDIKEGMSFIYNGHSIVKIEYAIEDDGATCILYDSDDTDIAYITKIDPADFSILELDPVYIPSGSWIEVDMGGGSGNVVLPVNPATTPTTEGAMWIEIV